MFSYIVRVKRVTAPLGVPLSLLILEKHVEERKRKRGENLLERFLAIATSSNVAPKCLVPDEDVTESIKVLRTIFSISLSSSQFHMLMHVLKSQ